MAAKKKLERELNEAERKAFDSLARYKFAMFGYHAAMWVKLNRIGEFKRPNPFRVLVHQAQDRMGMKSRFRQLTPELKKQLLISDIEFNKRMSEGVLRGDIKLSEHSNNFGPAKTNSSKWRPTR